MVRIREEDSITLLYSPLALSLLYIYFYYSLAHCFWIYIVHCIRKGAICYRPSNGMDGLLQRYWWKLIFAENTLIIPILTLCDVYDGLCILFLTWTSSIFVFSLYLECFCICVFACACVKGVACLYMFVYKQYNLKPKWFRILYLYRNENNLESDHPFLFYMWISRCLKF